MADYDRKRLGADIQTVMLRHGLTIPAIAAARPALNKALLSRARAGQSISTGSFLLICEAFDLAPLDYLREDARSPHWHRQNDKRKQRVSQTVSRETGGAA